MISEILRKLKNDCPSLPWTLKPNVVQNFTRHLQFERKSSDSKNYPKIERLKLRNQVQKFAAAREMVKSMVISKTGRHVGQQFVYFQIKIIEISRKIQFLNIRLHENFNVHVK